MSFEFPTFKVAEIENVIDLKKHATTDGKNNLPRSNSRTFSNCENEAITKIDAIRNKEIKNAAKYLNPKKKIISDCQSELDQKPYYIEQFENIIQKTLNDASGKLSNLRNAFSIEDNQVRTFKLENHLSREPRPLSGIGIFIGLLIMLALFLFELEVNSRLLAPAMASGKKEGIAIAGAVAGLNVFVSFFIGYIALKHFHHVQIKKRIISKIGLFLYAIFIIYINWSMGAYRAIYESTGSNLTDILTGVAVAETITGSATFPWTVSLSFMSLILVFVGIGFALISLIDGYFFDDRYPGYGSVGKDRKEKLNEINRIRQHISTEINSKFRNEFQRSRDKQEKLIKNTLNDWSTNMTEVENVFEKYRRFANELDDGIDHVIGEYRTVNSMYRTTDEPTYWKDKEGKVKTRYYNMLEVKKHPEKVFLDFVNFYSTRDEIEKQRKTYQDIITNEANKYIGQINDYQLKVIKEINEIKEKYNVHSVA